MCYGYFSSAGLFDELNSDGWRRSFAGCICSLTTLQNEKPFDYWIRLHNANDIAGEGWKRQGKTLDDPFREVTVMFITNCPDPELSLTFKCKSLHEWTAADVQVRLDEYQRQDKFQQ